jgi:hypothetical protein
MDASEVDGRSSIFAREKPSAALGDVGVLPAAAEGSISEAEYGIALKVR